MKTRNWLAMLLLVLVSSVGRGQKLRTSVAAVVREMESYRILSYEYVGYGGDTSDQYFNFVYLRDHATTAELRRLLQHKNNVIKGYAGWALVDKKFPRLSDVFISFLKSGATVVSQNGCVSFESELAGELYYQVLRHIDDDPDSLWFSGQLKCLDSIALYTNGTTDLQDNALEHNNAHPARHERVKELAQKGYRNAFIALAAYKEQEDIPFYISNKERSFPAIALFPDKAFWPLLRSYKTTSRSHDYFSAVAAYQDTAALSLLHYIYPSCDSKQVVYLDRALIRYYCPLYQDLVLDIWSTHGIIDCSVTQKLVAEQPEMLVQRFAEGLMLDKEFDIIQVFPERASEDSVIGLMLQTIAAADTALCLQVCNHNIGSPYLMRLKPFLDCITTHKITGTKDQLLARLAKKNPTFEIYDLMTALLSFGDSAVNKAILPILQANRKDWDWDNWSKSFRETLQQHSLKLE